MKLGKLAVNNTRQKERHELRKHANKTAKSTSGQYLATTECQLYFDTKESQRIHKNATNQRVMTKTAMAPRGGFQKHMEMSANSKNLGGTCLIKTNHQHVKMKAFNNETNKTEYNNFTNETDG